MSPALATRPPLPTAAPRAQGSAHLRCRRDGRATRIARLRTSGCQKLLFPAPGGPRLEAVAVNTSGGLTGGDRLESLLELEDGAALDVTTQAAERIYRAAEGVARVQTRADLAAGATLHWLPQETILFDGATLDRSFEADLHPDARLVLYETVIFGRRLRGERLLHGRWSDRITLRRDGAPLWRDRIAFEGGLDAHPRRAALLAGAGAMATLVLVAPEAEARLAGLRAALGPGGGASCPRPGVLVGRLLARDGIALRAALEAALPPLTGTALPAVWRS